MTAEFMQEYLGARNASTAATHGTIWVARAFGIRWDYDDSSCGKKLVTQSVILSSGKYFLIDHLRRIVANGRDLEAQEFELAVLHVSEPGAASREFTASIEADPRSGGAEVIVRLTPTSSSRYNDSVLWYVDSRNYAVTKTTIIGTNRRALLTSFAKVDFGKVVHSEWFVVDLSVLKSYRREHGSPLMFSPLRFAHCVTDEKSIDANRNDDLR